MTYTDLLIIEPSEPLRPTFDYASCPIYFCANCSSNLEPAVLDSLRRHYQDVEASLANYSNYYLASSFAGNPHYVFVFLPVACSCGSTLRAFFYFKFLRDGEMPSSENQIMLAEIEPRKPLSEIVDGIYTRDDCLTFLEKFLIRWRVLSQITFLAVPFIADRFQSEEKVLDLWDKLLAHVEPEQAAIVSRKGSWRLLDKALEKYGGRSLLQSAGRLHPTVRHPFSKQKFHAKFFAGMGKTVTECLIGSHNIYPGNYLENLLQKDYPTGVFFDRYLDPMNTYPVAPIPERQALVLSFDGRGVHECLECFEGTAEEVIKRFL